MPRLTSAGGRKRRAEPEEEQDPESSPEPATQRRRTSIGDEDLNERVDEHEEANNDLSYGGDGGSNDDASLDQMVKKLVRLALACEFQRRPIRRVDISDKVLAGGQAGRKFKAVFLQAQAELKAVFGMEMVELPAREKVTIAQKRAAAKQSQAAKPSTTSTTSTAWILTSVLPPQFRDPAIIAPPGAPTAAEDSKYTALYTMLIALISLSGNALPEAKLERWLMRLYLTDTAPLDGGRERTDKLLKRMEKEGYVVRVKESVGTGDDDIYWTVGPRGKVEVGDDGVRGLVRTVYAPDDEAGEEELERRIARSLGLGEKRRREADAEVAGSSDAAQKRRGRGRRKVAEDDQGSDEEDSDEQGD